MENRFYKKGELDDYGILGALTDAHDDYSNGEIVEARDLLEEIVFAIDEFILDREA